MSKDENKNHTRKNLTHMPWHEHLREFLVNQYINLLIYLVALFGIFWGLIEAASFFYPEISLSNGYLLVAILIICTISSLTRCVYQYRGTIQDGLESESKNAQRIAFAKIPFWEYSLAYELLNNRIKDIDVKLEDVLNNRVHIRIVRTLGVHDYIRWMQTRPGNLLRLINVSRQLLIFDLIEAIHADENNDVNYRNLVRVINLIEDAYRSTYEYEVEGREIKVPDEFEVVHEIQSGWASVIRDGFRQMLNILESVSRRKKGDSSPLDQTIVFDSPPRVDEFCKEMDRLSLIFEENSFS